jgi:hypothetical protein
MKRHLALLAVLMVATGARASVIDSGKIEDDSQNLNVPLSSNRLDTEISVEQEQRERAERPTSSMELNLSSWEPSSLQPPTRISNAGSFGLAGPPTLQLNGITPLSRDLNLVTGLQFLAMDRSADLGVDGNDDSETQTAYVPSIRLGIQYAPVKFSSKLFRPYVSAAVLPTAVITGRTAFDDGETDFGVAGEAGAGTLVHVSSAFDLNVNITETIGRVTTSSLNGFGVGAGVRVGL